MLKTREHSHTITTVSVHFELVFFFFMLYNSIKNNRRDLKLSPNTRISTIWTRYNLKKKKHPGGLSVIYNYIKVLFALWVQIYVKINEKHEQS